MKNPQAPERGGKVTARETQVGRVLLLLLEVQRPDIWATLRLTQRTEHVALTAMSAAGNFIAGGSAAHRVLLYFGADG